MTIFGFGKKEAALPHPGGARSLPSREQGIRVWTQKTTLRLYKIAKWAALLLLIQSIFLLKFQNDSGLKVNLLLQMAALILFALFCRAAAATYLSAPIVFVSSIFLWHSTFLVGHYFQVDPAFEDAAGTFSIGYQYIHKATALVGLSLSLTIIGMVLGYKRQRIEAKTRPSQSSVTRRLYSTPGPTTRRIAWYLFSGMIAIFVFFIIREGVSAFGGRYIDLYANPPSSLGAVLFFRTELFWAFVICLLIACHRDSRVRYLLAIIIVVLCGLLAMLGPRTGPFLCLVALLLSWDTFVSRIKIRWIAVFFLILSATSFIIAVGRGVGLGAQVFRFSENSQGALNLLDIFREQGQTIMVVLRTMEFTSAGGLKYGRTFIDAIVSVVPLPILKLVGFRFSDSLSDFVVANSPDVPLFQGLGSSLIAELYYNFGILGCLGFLIIGWYISRAYFRHIFLGDVFTGVKVMTIASTYTVMMRNDIGSCWRLLFYAFIIVGLLRRKKVESFTKHSVSSSKNPTLGVPGQAPAKLVG